MAVRTIADGGPSGPPDALTVKRAAKAAYMRGWYQQNKAKTMAHAKAWKDKHRALIEDYKKRHPCVRCGEKDHRCLTFHHLRDKKHNVSQMPSSGFRWETILAEINKCEVLCANCHAREHYRAPNDQKTSFKSSPGGL